MPTDLPVTMMNAVWYAVLTSYLGTPALYILQNLHDMQVALTSDLYFSLIAYSIYNTALFNTSLTEDYLDSIGMSPAQIEDLQQDPNYGWASAGSSKIWVQAYFDYLASGNLDLGAYDVIRNYFQNSLFGQIISPGGLINTLVSGVIKDMENRYGSSNATVLGCMQWANATLTENPPLGLAPIVSPLYKFSTYNAMNSTLSFVPEMKGFLNISGKPWVDYSAYAQSLLQVVYTYPNYNPGSIVNIDNLAYFAQNLAAGNFSNLESR